ncbi:MAG: toll/interleukin-1 receptor domain-containing protein [Chloroflexota bacterium]
MAQLFISYSRKHPVYADFLMEDLERDGYSSWIDRSDIIGGEAWRQSIYNGIESSLVMLLIVTEESLQSEVIREEVAYAIEKGKACIPLIMQRLDTETVLKHWNLEHAQAIDFVADRRKDAYAKLLLSLKKLMDTWGPLEKQIDRLNHFSTKVRREAAEHLGASRDIRVLEPLIEAIQIEPDEAVWKAMLWELRNFPNPTALAVVAKIADSRKVYNPGKLTALRVLREIGVDHDEIAQQLLRMLVHYKRDWNEQIAISEVLYRFSDPEVKDAGLHNLFSLLKSDDENARANAAAILGKLGDLRAIPMLEAVLAKDEDSDTRKMAEQALVILKDNDG